MALRLVSRSAPLINRTTRFARTPVPVLTSRAARSFASKSDKAPEVTVPYELQNIGVRQYGDLTQQQRLPSSVVKALQEARKTGKRVPKEVANAIATDVKNWAFEQGAVCFTHWFSPIRTAIQGEKYDSFVDLNYKTKEVIADFSGAKLFMGETDGSSFPNGDLRATHTAAAYMVWDTSSPMFVRNDCLYIPAAFVSHNGDALDEKTPLLRAQEAVNEQGLRLLRAIGDKTTKRVVSNVGWEQEFFIVDRELFLHRPDLMACGRTLCGSVPPRHQQTSQCYFGRIPLRVRAFLNEMRAEMWELGASISTLHNEVAPAQHETAPIFSLTNYAADQNMMLWDVMHEAAARHGLVVLFHEKPFAGMNGSGKHNNWGLNTDDGSNLFVAGKTAEEQKRFMTFVAALARTIRTHGDILRAGVATHGNDFRLGGHEAPPPIISLYTGHEMEKHIRAIVKGGPLEGYGTQPRRVLQTGATCVLETDTPLEDRNRTAPFPFCGNRFEFRAVGANQNINFPLALLNTAMADSLGNVADLIESGKSHRDAVQKTFAENIDAVFNGNNYSKEWREEAKKRGLTNLANTPAAVAQFDSAKNIALFKRMKVFTEREVKARKAIMLEQYALASQIESDTFRGMLQKGFIPAMARDLHDTKEAPFKSYNDKKAAAYKAVLANAEKLDEVSSKVPDDAVEAANYWSTTVKDQMLATRKAVDAAEKFLPEDLYPYPTYEELLYSHHYDAAPAVAPQLAFDDAVDG